MEEKVTLPDIKTPLPGPKAKAIIERDKQFGKRADRVPATLATTAV